MLAITGIATVLMGAFVLLDRLWAVHRGRRSLRRMQAYVDALTAEAARQQARNDVTNRAARQVGAQAAILWPDDTMTVIGDS